MGEMMNKKREITYLEINQIYPNPYQPRKSFDENSLEELALSIRRYGVIEPICVRYLKGDFYEIIAGERRLKACKKIGLNEIPAVILNMTDKDSAFVALIENIQRENLNFIEEGEGFQTLMVDFGYTQEEIAKIVGKKQSTVSNKLRILRLKKDIKRLIIDNGLTERHARALLKINNDDMQREILDKIIEFDLNVQKTEEFIQNRLDEMSGKSLKSMQKIKGYIGDVRIFTNTIKGAVDVMKQSGVDTDYSIEKNEGGYEIKIKVCM